MRFRKVVFGVSILLTCLTFVARSAKADDITFHDLQDTITVDGSASSRFIIPTGCTTTAALEACTVTLAAPIGAHFSGSNLPTSYTISEGNNTLSDEIDPVIFVAGNPFVEFKFLSNGPGVAGAGEPSVLPCPATGCNITENGTVQQTFDATGNLITIDWAIGTPGINETIVAQDTISFESDVTPGEVPEPASLILFGSGLVMAGGFLRRRRRVVMPSVVA